MSASMDDIYCVREDNEIIFSKVGVDKEWKEIPAIKDEGLKIHRVACGESHTIYLDGQ